MPGRAPWRLAVLNDARIILGAGFLISPELALTCAHVVANYTAADRAAPLRVQCGGADSRLIPARVHDLPGDGEPDVAVLELAQPVTGIAPALPGPAEPPPMGSLLAAFGFPRMHRAREPEERPAAGALVETGIWVPVSVDGFDLAGQRIQLTSRNPQGMPVQRGFSGGPVIDPDGDLVAGMICHALPGYPMSLMIPIGTLSDVSPQLRASLRPRIPAEREFGQGLAALQAGNYAAALANFRVLCARHPEHADTWYYVVLAALHGRRPRAHARGFIEEIAELLEQAARIPPPKPHVLALWALIKEDFYHARGLAGGTPTLEQLRRGCSAITPGHAAELCLHVPAVETRTWKELDYRREAS